MNQANTKVKPHNRTPCGQYGQASPLPPLTSKFGFYSPCYFYAMAEHKVNVNGKGFDVVLEDAASGSINGKPFALDVQRVSENIWHVIRDHRTYEVEMLDEGRIKVNGAIYTTETIDRFDALLKQLGMERGAGGKVAEVKAPMPGLVLKILVAAGATVSKGDALLVLEAMKMENVIKSPTDGTIASIEVQQGKTVEKNEVMIKFI